MTIENPQNPITLPRDLALEIEKVKKQIAVHEQEVINLQKTRLAEEYAIRELLKQKESLQAEISELDNKVASGNEKKTAIDVHNSKVSAENRKLEIMNDQLSVEVENKRKELEGKEVSLEAREHELKIEQSKLVTQIEEIRIREAKIIAFSEKISKVIAEF